MFNQLRNLNENNKKKKKEKISIFGNVNLRMDSANFQL